MEAFQERVIDEKLEVDTRLSALNKFRASKQHATLPEAEQQRLYRQKLAMENYSSVLSERINAFTTEVASGQG